MKNFNSKKLNWFNFIKIFTAVIFIVTTILAIYFSKNTIAKTATTYITRPPNGSQVSNGVNFCWTDTQPGGPYHLQVATTSTFSGSSIIDDAKNLTSNCYVENNLSSLPTKTQIYCKVDDGTGFGSITSYFTK